MTKETTHPVISRNPSDAVTPGVQVEHTAAQAEHEGAFRETALSEKDAWESNASNDSGKPDAGEEPLFLTKEIETELKAAGNYKVEVPTKICRATIRDLFGWKPGETLEQAIARKKAASGD